MTLIDKKNGPTKRDLNVADQATRDELLDISQSYIVQAPAGSGKTELLTQRILKLLTKVEKPENVLALTFTRKAAAEMRDRVIDALRLAKGKPPESNHELRRYQLARLVLKIDQKFGWKIIENPSRLNLLTIDSLASSLSGALPILSQTGTVPSIEENSMPLYLEATERLLGEIGGAGRVSKNIQTILRHKDNNLKQVIRLIAELLSKRLYWLGKDWMNPSDNRAIQTSKNESCIDIKRNKIWESVDVIVGEKLREAYELIPTDIISELPPLLRQVSEVLNSPNDSNTDQLLNEKLNKPVGLPDHTDHKLWLAIANLLLTKNTSTPSLFVSPNKKQGFPTKSDAANDLQASQFATNKAMIVSILDDLANHENHRQIVDILNQIRMLPIEPSDSTELKVLNAITELLPVAAGYLKLLFKEKNTVDFTELSIASLEALGSEQAPSDYALALDHRIKHILVDEFQDTSSPQIRLIELLVAGWDEAENRSLFLVGDPMQSIYRFRDANVSLFLKVVENGIGQLRPIFRQLETNFRSEKPIIDWVNQHFSKIMPKKSDVTFGAVSYSASTAFHNSPKSSKVNTILTVDASDSAVQAEKVISIIESHIEENKNTTSINKTDPKTLAVLVKSRNHLRDVIGLLNEKSIVFQAIELESLSEKIIVQDLLSLALALTDTYNQQAWLSCLHSPWFGLTMADIIVVVDISNQLGIDTPSVLSIICDNSLPIEKEQAELSLSDTSLTRIKRIQPIIKCALSQKAKKPFRKWLLGCFEAVGGTFQLDKESDFSDLNCCLDTIASFEDGGEISDVVGLNTAITRLYAAPNPLADNQVQIMTIHKSKGLEFDRVIIPHIDSWGTPPDTSLMNWSEVTDKSGKNHHLLAVSKATGKDQSSLYRFISSLEKRKQHYELQRLFYVATTRAKLELYLLGNINTDNKALNKEIVAYKTPTKGSFLSLIWSHLNTASVAESVPNSNIGQNTNPAFSVVSCNHIPRDVGTTQMSKELNESDIKEIKTLDTLNKQIRAIFPSRKIKRVFIEKVLPVPHEYRLSLDNTSDSNEFQPPEKPEGEITLAPESIAIGNVIHRQLEWLSKLFGQKRYTDNQQENIQNFQLPKNWKTRTEEQLVKELHRSSNNKSIVDYNISEMAIQVVKAIKNTLADPNGRFILSSHASAQSEYVLQSVVSENQVNRSIIDRTFIYENKRWIIDYKSAKPKQGEVLQSFLKRETDCYYEQLKNYAGLFQKMGENNIVTALYFPQIPHFEIVESLTANE